MTEANDVDLRQDAQKEWDLINGWDGKPARYLEGRMAVQLGRSSVAEAGWWQLDIGCGEFRPHSSLSMPQPGENVGREVCVWVESWLLSSEATTDTIDACAARAMPDGHPAATWIGIGRVTQERCSVSMEGKENFHFKMSAKAVPALNKLCLAKAKARIVAFMVQKAPEQPKLNPGEQPLPGILDQAPVTPAAPGAVDGVCDDDGVVVDRLRLCAPVRELEHEESQRPLLQGPSNVVDAEIVDDDEDEEDGTTPPPAPDKVPPDEMLRAFLKSRGGQLATFRCRIIGPEGLNHLTDEALVALAASRPDLFVVSRDEYHNEVVTLVSPSADDLELLLLDKGLRDHWRGMGWIQDQLRLAINCTHPTAAAWAKRLCEAPKRFRRREQGVGFEAVQA